MESEENKHEIILSKETKNLTIFSSTGLITRGQKLADLVLVKSPLLTKIEGILLAKLSEISHKNGKYPLFHKINLAVALLEIRNKSSENWAIGVLNEESEESGDIAQISNPKRELLQVLAKLGKREIASEYVLEKFRKHWNGTGFLPSLGWIFNLLSDKQAGSLIELFSNANESSKIGIIIVLGKSGRKQKEIISYLQGVAKNDTSAVIKILACEALINLDQIVIAQNALTPILRYSYFADDAKILLALIENTKEASDQATSMLLEKIQKKPGMLLEYNLYLPKLGQKELAISLMLLVLTSPGADKKENRWKFKSAIDALIELDCRNENFLDRLVDLSTDSKVDTWLRLQSFSAMLEFENINETQAETLVIFSQSDGNQSHKVCAACVLSSFERTENVGVDFLVRSLSGKWSIVLGFSGISEIFIKNKRLALNTKFLKMLLDMPNKELGTSQCLTIIKMLKKAEQ